MNHVIRPIGGDGEDHVVCIGSYKWWEVEGSVEVREQSLARS